MYREEDKEFANALIKMYPNGIPEDIKHRLSKCSMEYYDIETVMEELNGYSETPYGY